MTDRVLALFAPALRPGGSVLLDATLGRAGHASALLSQHPGLTLIGVDADDAAIEASRKVLAPYGGRVTLVHARYDAIGEILAALGQPSVHGVLFDLGVSSPQLDDPSRGFAYSYDAPLDMRMDQTGPLTAADVVNTYPAARLAQVLREYGEERFARRIADAVVRERAKSPFTSTMRLSEIVRDVDPGPGPAHRRQPGEAHLPGPANRGQRRTRGAAPGPARGPGRGGGRRPDRGARLPLARGPPGQAGSRGGRGDTTPPGLPVALESGRPRFRLLTRGAERPTAAEVAANPRAASARLRAAERVRAA